MTNIPAFDSRASVAAPRLREDDASLPAVELPAANQNQRSGDLSFGKLAGLFVLLLAITAIPVVLHPWPPMSDYVNHLARMQVLPPIKTDPDLARFYEI